VLLPLAPGLELHLVTAAHQLGAERDRRERMAGIAEGGEGDPARDGRRAQTSSARSVSMRERFSGSVSGVITIVPTPASR
jgi:hypothetical protein